MAWRRSRGVRPGRHLDDDQIYHYQWFHFAVREAHGERQLATPTTTLMWRGASAITDLLGTPTPIRFGAEHGGGDAGLGRVHQMDGDLQGRHRDDRSANDKVIAKPARRSECGGFARSRGDRSSSPRRRRCRRSRRLGATRSIRRLDRAAHRCWRGPVHDRPAEVPAQASCCRRRYLVTFSAARRLGLSAIFPLGVCGLGSGARGANQTPVVPYASFGPSRVGQEVFRHHTTP